MPPNIEKLTSAAVANAAFGAPKGGYAALAQSGLGYHVVHIDSVAAVAGKSLDQARAEITADLSKAKIDTALSDFVAKIEDEINGGATFDDVAKKHVLTAASTPPITAGGIAPDVQDYKLPAELQPVLRDAFQAETRDDPQVGTVANGASFALYHMDNIVPSAAKPLGAIRAQVMADAQVSRAAIAAKRVADGIIAKVNAGIPLADALSGAGVKLPAARPVSARRLDFVQGGDKVPPPVKLLFGLANKRAGVLTAGQGAGWFIVYVDKIVAGDIGIAPQLITNTQAQLTRVVGEEYAQQFASSIKKQLGVTRNATAIAALKQSLTGSAARQ